MILEKKKKGKIDVVWDGMGNFPFVSFSLLVLVLRKPQKATSKTKTKQATLKRLFFIIYSTHYLLIYSIKYVHFIF